MITTTTIINWIIEAIIKVEGEEKWNSMTGEEQHDEIIGFAKYWLSTLQ